MAKTSQQIQPYFGAFVLETLTVGMYGESRNAIREYIQNGFDAIEHAIATGVLRPGEGHIQIRMGDDELIIRDNGTGIGIRKATDTLVQIGASTKDYRTNAGFRGIGRLAGIVFSKRITFSTKARGETEQTTVIFDAVRMRTLMRPERGSTLNAQDLIQRCVEAYTEPSQSVEDHFFEVHLEGFVDAPPECREAPLMHDFVSQVAPVRYQEEFPFRVRLAEQAQAHRLPIEEVRITIQEGRGGPVEVMKPYGRRYDTEKGEVELTDCEIESGADDAWWGWIGKKSKSGAYTSPRVSGIRVRMKNIQIDGTDIIRAIFQSHSKSYSRFQDWYVGEIFVRPSAVVPNARRDGFEEDPDWLRIRKELSGVVKGLGREAYDLSKEAQTSIDVLETKIAEQHEVLNRLRRNDFSNVDRVLAASAEVTKLQQKVSQAARDADLETQTTLQAFASELADIKAEMVRGLGPAPEPVDVEELELEIQERVLRELLELLRNEVQSTCFAQVRNVLEQHYGLTPK